MRHARLARRYAKALLNAAEEAGSYASLRAGLDELSGLYAESADFRAFVEDPTLPPNKKREVFHRLAESGVLAPSERDARNVSSGRPDPLLMSFLDLLVANQRERALDAILEESLRMLDEREGIHTALVTSAVPLEAAHRDALAAALTRVTGKEIRLETAVNPELVAGFVIRIGDVTYDASFATQLKRLHHALAVG